MKITMILLNSSLGYFNLGVTEYYMTKCMYFFRKNTELTFTFICHKIRTQSF